MNHQRAQLPSPHACSRFPFSRGQLSFASVNFAELSFKANIKVCWDCPQRGAEKHISGFKMEIINASGSWQHNTSTGPWGPIHTTKCNIDFGCLSNSSHGHYCYVPSQAVFWLIFSQALTIYCVSGGLAETSSGPGGQDIITFSTCFPLLLFSPCGLSGEGIEGPDCYWSEFEELSHCYCFHFPVLQMYSPKSSLLPFSKY